MVALLILSVLYLAAITWFLAGDTIQKALASVLESYETALLANGLVSEGESNICASTSINTPAGTTHSYEKTICSHQTDNKQMQSSTR